MPDIRNYSSDNNLGRPFARFDYMGVKPTLSACNGILSLFKGCRKNGIKLSRCHLEDEQRAYLVIKNNEYVTTNYWWQNNE